MTISVECKGCSRRLNVKDEFAGRRFKCPHCQEVQSVPNATQALAATIVPGNETATRRFELGEKNCCPKCGSDRVRAMSPDEMQKYYGGNLFVLSPPRKCQTCGHEYETIPSRFGCYTMLFLSSLCVLLGAGLMIFGILAPFILWGSERFTQNPLWVIVRSMAAVSLGGATVYGSIRGFSKYQWLLKQIRA